MNDQRQGLILRHVTECQLCYIGWRPHFPISATGTPTWARVLSNKRPGRVFSGTPGFTIPGTSTRRFMVGLRRVYF